MPEVSIIIPVYNVNNRIRKCLDTVKQQIFTDFECILIDDGSMDGSGEICDEYALSDSRFHVIHQHNMGVSKARNVGIEAANGRYIAFIDGDDYVESQFLYKLYHAIVNADADIAFCNYYSVRTNGSTIPEIHSFADDVVFTRDEIETELFSRIRENRNTTGFFSLWNKLFRLEIIRENHLMLRTDMSFGEDMFFVLELFGICNKIVFLDTPLYFYEQTPDGLFSKYRRSFLHDIMECYNKACSLVIRNTDLTAMLPLSLKYYAYLLRYYVGVAKNEKEKYKIIRESFNNMSVRLIYNVLLEAVNRQDASGFDSQDIRLIRIVGRRCYNLASILLLYYYDESFVLRKLRRFGSK